MAWKNKEEEKLERREENARREQQGPAAEREKPKRSWKEIDATRDGTKGSHGGGERSGLGRGENPAYRNYKSRLDKIFDGQIKLGAKVAVEVMRPKEHKAAPTPIALPEQPKSARERLKDASSDAEVHAAATELLAAGGLPLDSELILKVLVQSDASLYLPALETLLDAMERGRPKSAKAIVARLQALLPTLSNDAADIAKGICSRIA